MKKLVVLISGNGSNLQSILDACASGRINGSVAAVFSNKESAYGLTRAQQASVPGLALSPGDFPDRETFDRQLMQEIDAFEPDLVVLAGYMRILSSAFVAHYHDRLLNIHPSLLPKYPGLHTHRQALENGDKEHGTSVHFVTDELDGGPVVLQARVPIFPGDDEAEITARVQHQEHAIYPLAISWFMDGRLVMREGKAWLDGQLLPAQGYAP
ncbi:MULTISPECIES: phosphoribosylglycinamide formyltransferase [Pantoea]|uniref:phosphoribosylglycinamide formyltransferase n=1 Tax=Pantoea TaxID=53335 RepID=UPI000A225805|nr:MULTISPECIES: phosphoribosylglycinamide formyltransferase [Pantoea]KAA6050535.1 phosphoribosylglycinamide formyltransferase [Pantoea sp. Bo_7]KAA6094887.1 phosphoribosylglycinamide formyltransferase [Pantoea sp. Bo_10]ORM76693.1 phosphoribosylglycinamide formyltransferase [Pantoea eucrina]RBO11315.1 phosphoribosylglycinamide formyltransferase [Pantoea sp. 3_1284]